jgi:hypothetical protein
VSVVDLVAIARDSLDRWPWIADLETSRGLPSHLLLAVGLRETGLRHIVGDGGHGHGPWQYDDRTTGRAAAIARIDRGDTQYAAEIAADMLRGLFGRYGDWLSALNAYNSGQPQTRFTAHGDYGPSVLAALAFLQATISNPQPQVDPQPLPEDDMIATDPTTGDYWVLTGPEGGIDSYNADGTPGGRYFGNPIDHPEYGVGPGKPLGPAVGIAFWPQGVDGGGYVIFSRDPSGHVHPYRFDRTTRKS